MSRFQRMVVIPETEYTQLQLNSQLVRSEKPIEQQFQSTSKQYDEEKLIPDEFTRLLKQGSTLERLKDLKTEIRENMDLGTPKQYRARANALYSAIQSRIKLSDKGELIDMNDHAIPKSHIGDLIQYAVRDKRRSFEPTGWVQFIQQLHDLNAPMSPLNTETIEEIRKLNIPSSTPVTSNMVSDVKRKPSFKHARSKSSIKREITDEDENADDNSGFLKTYGVKTRQRSRVETKKYPKSSFLRY